ncbi:unnamed protein product [Cylindrotheca closterium]|uniref:Uncharacterized protein n=1 Tax=Cylindrotheca closterium TaxID=2856 RepID=A0AAD2G4E2_9STRA|nr:unnamed protein product [Cylindrotheca closterium]
MKDNLINPPEKAPNLITTVADQGQGGLEAKTRSNLTTQSSIALTKDNPAITTPKRSSKRHPSETAKDRPLPTSRNSRCHSFAGSTRRLGDRRCLLSQRPNALSLLTKIPAIIPHIAEEFERLKREPTIAKAQSKFKKRLASTPANLKGAKAHDSPENLNPSNEPMEFVEIVWHALTTAFPTKQGWNQNKELLSYLHTTTILFYDVYAAHQKWPPTMGPNDNKSQEMALKSTRTAPEHAQEGLEATTRSNSTTLLTVDL